MLMQLVLRRPIGNRKKAKRVLDSDDEDEDSIAHSRRSQGTSRTKRRVLLLISYLIRH